MKCNPQKPLLLSLSLLLVTFHCDARSVSTRGDAESGLATYYADHYHNKMTASGELYRHELHTAAHMDLPLGSMVKVTNLTNKKSVVVKINDRGDFVTGRIIDLSTTAFKKIGDIHRGVIKVKIEVVKG
ncbi:MAG: septal ring lytic transglycosylase RlpA family protein [Shewanella sp.]